MNLLSVLIPKDHIEVKKQGPEPVDNVLFVRGEGMHTCICMYPGKSHEKLLKDEYYWLVGGRNNDTDGMWWENTFLYFYL